MVQLKDVFLLNNNDTVADVFGTPAQLINTIVPNVFVIAGLIMFFLLIFGGFSIIAAGGDPKSVEKGTKEVTGAVIGFLIIIASYWIVQIVEIVTGIKIFNSAL